MFQSLEAMIQEIKDKEEKYGLSRLVAGSKVKVTTEKSNLNIRKGPGTDQPIVGKAAHHEVVTLVSRTNDQWWLVRTNDGEEGYAFAEYLTPEAN